MSPGLSTHPPTHPPHRVMSLVLCLVDIHAFCPRAYLQRLVASGLLDPPCSAGGSGGWVGTAQMYVGHLRCPAPPPPTPLHHYLPCLPCCNLTCPHLPRLTLTCPAAVSPACCPWSTPLPASPIWASCPPHLPLPAA